MCSLSYEVHECNMYATGSTVYLKEQDVKDFYICWSLHGAFATIPAVSLEQLSIGYQSRKCTHYFLLMVPLFLNTFLMQGNIVMLCC